MIVRRGKPSNILIPRNVLHTPPPPFEKWLMPLSISQIQRNLVIKSDGYDKTLLYDNIIYNKVILLVPALYILKAQR